MTRTISERVYDGLVQRSGGRHLLDRHVVGIGQGRTTAVSSQASTAFASTARSLQRQGGHLAGDVGVLIGVGGLAWLAAAAVFSRAAEQPAAESAAAFAALGPEAARGFLAALGLAAVPVGLRLPEVSGDRAAEA